MLNLKVKALDSQSVLAKFCLISQGGHSSYHEATKGQSFELAFPCETPEDVKKSYIEIVEKGATPIKKPSLMPWGQTTAFFADPDGNIHEIFCS